MSGHSKWSKIKRQKGKADAAKGNLFTRLAREITIAARHGGGDPSYNAALRTAIDRAKAENLPNANVDRAIQRGTGELEGAIIEETLYEGFGPAKVALLVRCVTDNKNRTVSELRTLFRKAGCALGESGSVAWMFDYRGVFQFDAPVDVDKVMDVAVEAGAEDVTPDDEGGVEVLTTIEQFDAVRKAFQAAGLKPSNAELAYVPNTMVPVSEADGEKVMQFIEHVEEHEDVQNVYANPDMPSPVPA